MDVVCAVCRMCNVQCAMCNVFLTKNVVSDFGYVVSSKFEIFFHGQTAITRRMATFQGLRRFLLSNNDEETV